MTLEEAQAALLVAQQEVVDATAALESATELATTLGVARDTAQIAYNEALAAWEATKVTHPGTTTTTTQNVVQNGTFDSAAGWSNVVNSTTVYTGGASPIAINGKLKGSYTAGIYIQQTGTFPSPTRQVTFSVDVWNYDTNEGNRINNPDYYRIEFRTYDAAGNRLNYYNLEYSQWHNNWITRGGTYTLSADAVRWDIGFRMQDAGYWAGAFGPEMDNVQLIATMGTTTPETYTYGAAETTAKNAAYDALQSAQASLTSANLAKSQAESRLNAALAEVQRLTSLVAELTPHLNAPTGLVAVINGDNVDLTWNAPVSNLSGIQVERYDISWSTTNFVENGWGWNHDQTSISIPLSILNQYGGLGNTFQFAIRADNNTESIYSPRSNIVSIQTVEPAWWQIQFNENDTVTIGAPDGFTFGTPRAWYGDPNSSCGLDVSSQVSEAIYGRSTGSFVANNDLFTDPCPGIGKVLRLSTPVVAITIIPTPEPSPQPTPTVEPTISPTPTPSPTPSETPVIIEPTPMPTVQPTEEPVVPTPEPTVEPTIPPTEEPTPTPTQSQEPVEEPTTSEPQPSPAPEPSKTPEPQPEPKLSVEEAVVAIESLVAVAPEKLTDAQVEQLVEAALAVFETAEQGSQEYAQALEALAVAAEADDPELPAELAAIPGAAAVLEAFNNLGNIGADMSPAIREEAEKTVIASVIAAGAAVNAVAAASMASSGTTGGSSSGASSGGSGSTRRKE